MGDSRETITRVSGDLGIGRHVAVGGDVVVQGDALNKGDLRVEGWLDAPNIRHPNKGLFASEEELVACYPVPQNGWWAIVGKTSNGKTYYVRDGKWVASGENDGSVDSAVEASHAKEADYAKEAGQALEARHAEHSDNSDEWHGEEFGDWLDQAVRRQDDVEFGSIKTHGYKEGERGASITNYGDIEANSLVLRTYLKVQELIYNRLNALEGDVSFADVGTVEFVMDSGGGTYSLEIRKRWDGDFTSFQPGDIVYGYVNNLLSAAKKEWYRCWGVIKSVDRERNILHVTQYPDEAVPGRHNYPFSEGMLISRWGNVIEANGETWLNGDYSSFIQKKGGKYVNTRQRSFMVSCDDGRIVELVGVRAPVLSAENYGTVLGRIPDGLLPSGVSELVSGDQPYLYARGVIVQDLIRIGYEGVTVRTANYRGVWNAETAASETDYYRATQAVYDTVTYRNALWQCVVSKSTDEPGDSSAAWVKMTATDDDAPETKVWTVVPNANVIAIRPAEVKPEKITCSVTLVSSKTGTRSITSNYELNGEGAALYFSTDEGQTWQVFVVGAEEPLETESGESLEMELDGYTITIGGNDIDTASIGERIVFQLRDTESGAVLSQSSIPVVRDGIDGAQGVPGREGLLVYPAGMYNKFDIYSAQGDSCPVVEYGGQYYRLKVGALWAGGSEGRDNPALDVAANDEQTVWMLFDSFRSIFTDVIMAEFAKLASAVFYGDWMISQHGINPATGEASEDYQKFKDKAFRPNVAIDFLNGELRARKGTFSGEIVTEFVTLSDSDFNDDMQFTINGVAYTHWYNMADKPTVLKLCYSDSGVIVLPSSAANIGARVVICSTSVDYANKPTVKIVAADGTYIRGVVNSGGTSPKRIEVFDGVVELMYCPTAQSGATGKWVVLTASGGELRYI